MKDLFKLIFEITKTAGKAGVLILAVIGFITLVGGMTK